MWKEHRVAELEETPVEITVKCGCTRVLTVSRAWFFENVGPDATFEDCERRMLCRDCGKRPSLSLSLPWGLSGDRDRRLMADRTPLPSWVPMLS